MRFFTGMARKLLARAAVGGALVLISASGSSQTAAPAPAATATSAAALSASAPPAVALPSRFRNQPTDALTSSARDPALGEAELARLIALGIGHSPLRAQAVARIDAVRPSFRRSGDEEKRALEADLARLDEQLAEEAAHAWFDGRAADARLGVAHFINALAAQGLQLVNQRMAAGLATQADLERLHEAAIKARALTARATQERSAAVARIAALTGEHASFTAGANAASAENAAPAIRAAIRAATPATLQERADVRAARIRAAYASLQRDASAAELAAFHRESLLKALEETEQAYAAAVNARAQRSGAAELAATAARQSAAMLAQLEAGRIGRLQHVEVQLAQQDARLREIDTAVLYAKALATLERALGR